ncbi:hypothetical protein KP509_13G032200 [Ceratopteris richardii]|uniref:Uncharacterized protein n=1 Tax=Ceratopteris richardii TaxID=49495 RepID=A0A8T2THS1_CERRI|nr:hypothetical protein KP509_13G032200 [Ceratopteris richardii]
MLPHNILAFIRASFALFRHSSSANPCSSSVLCNRRELLSCISRRSCNIMAVPHDTSVRIRDVWRCNAAAEFKLIGNLKQEFSTIVIDTEFPGSLKLDFLCSEQDSNEDSIYRTLKENVNMMKLIQVGITLVDNWGRLPMIEGAYCVWQFNLCDFDMNNDIFVKASIQVLQNNGLESRTLGRLLLKHHLVFNPRMHYVCYQGDYDFAYVHEAVTGDQQLPSSLAEYTYSKISMFGRIFDVRCAQLQNFHTSYGLQKFSDSLGVKRISGTSHQAGSDSLLTASTYQAIKSLSTSFYNRHYSQTYSNKEKYAPNFHSSFYFC